MMNYLFFLTKNKNYPTPDFNIFENLESLPKLEKYFRNNFDNKRIVVCDIDFVYKMHKIYEFLLKHVELEFIVFIIDDLGKDQLEGRFSRRMRNNSLNILGNIQNKNNLFELFQIFEIPKNRRMTQNEIFGSFHDFMLMYEKYSIIGALVFDSQYHQY